jgi:2-phosphoglycerate kinase
MKGDAAVSFDVLLLGGASGTGKTRVAYPLARHFEVGVAAVDDLVTVLERMTTPEHLPALHFWESHPDPGSISASDIQLQGTEIMQVMMPALEAVIENHLEESTPVVLEGDFIHPALAARATFGEQANDGRVKAIFLVEADVDQLVLNYLEREPAIGPQTTRAEVSALWSAWFSRECSAYGVPAISARPWATLLERIVAATGGN